MTVQMIYLCNKVTIEWVCNSGVTVTRRKTEHAYEKYVFIEYILQEFNFNLFVFNLWYKCRLKKYGTKIIVCSYSTVKSMAHLAHALGTLPQSCGLFSD